MAELRRAIAQRLYGPADDKDPSVRSFDGLGCFRPPFPGLAPFVRLPLPTPASLELVLYHQHRQDHGNNQRKRNHRPQSRISKTLVEEPAHNSPLRALSWLQRRVSNIGL